MRIRWTPAAAADPQQINDYLSQHHLQYRQPNLRKVYAAIQSLKESPHRQHGRDVVADATCLAGRGNGSGTSIAPARTSVTLKEMEVDFAPDLQARIEELVVETGRAPEKLVEDAMAGYVAELVETRGMLDGGYDDLKSGRVELIPGDEVIARLRAKSAARRASHGS
jgi:plasmid stabilization system protein ParE